MLGVNTYPNPSGGLLVEAIVRNSGTLPTGNGFNTDIYLNHIPTGQGDRAGVDGSGHRVVLHARDRLESQRTRVRYGIQSDAELRYEEQGVRASHSKVNQFARIPRLDREFI